MVSAFRWSLEEITTLFNTKTYYYYYYGELHVNENTIVKHGFTC
jgi:hypothetical protein